MYSSLKWLFTTCLLAMLCNSFAIYMNQKKVQLTTALLSGGWVPEIPRSFHYWQPAPRWRPLPWLGNPGDPAMSPHAAGKKAGTHHIENISRKRGGKEGGQKPLNHYESLIIPYLPRLNSFEHTGLVLYLQAYKLQRGECFIREKTNTLKFRWWYR